MVGGRDGRRVGWRRWRWGGALRVAGGPVRGGRAARLGAHERASLLVSPVAVPGAGVVVVGSWGARRARWAGG